MSPRTLNVFRHVYTHTRIQGDWWPAFISFTILPHVLPGPTWPPQKTQLINSGRLWQWPLIRPCFQGFIPIYMSPFMHHALLSGGRGQVGRRQRLGSRGLTAACFCGILFLGTQLPCSKTIDRRTVGQVEKAQPVSANLFGDCSPPADCRRTT